MEPLRPAKTPRYFDSRQREQSWIVVAIISAWVLIGAFAALHPEFEIRGRWAGASPTSHDPEKDPVLGQIVKLPAEDVLGRPLPRPRRTVLVYAGQCSECSIAAVSPSRVTVPEGYGVVFVYAASRGAVEQFLVRHQFHVPTIADSEGTLSTRLNAVWAPRFYLLDDDWRLVDLQVRPNAPVEWAIVKGQARASATRPATGVYEFPGGEVR